MKVHHKYEFALLYKDYYQSKKKGGELMSTKYRVSKNKRYSRAEKHAYWQGVGIGLLKNSNGSEIVSKYSDKKKSSLVRGIQKGLNK